MSTKTLTNSGFKPERRHDYIYDNNYITSSERDHARSTFKSHTATDRIKRVPIYRTMFSEMRQFPNYQVRLEAQDPVPNFMNKKWGGYERQQREEVVRYTQQNYDPRVRLDPIYHADPEVSGRNRYLYFRRPIMPYIQAIPPTVILGTGINVDPLQSSQQVLKRVPTPTSKSVYIQTDYRDSEVQTDPYTPEYVIRPGEQPELLTLASLSHGRGLPAGLAEVEMIERARLKRAWEKTLPALSDLSQADKRRRMMDEMERSEWAVREAEIEKLQEERLEVLKKLLKQREENHQDMNIKRLDIIWSKRQKVKDAKVRKIREHHVKEIRKLLARRKNVEGKFERRELNKEYGHFESEVYAPLTRNGVFPDRNSERYVVKSRFLSSYQGLCELEASLPDFIMHPRIKAVKPQTVTKAGFIKRKYRQEMELADMHESLKALHQEVQEPPKPLKFLVRVEKPVPRPPTPAIEVPSQYEEERELAVTYLQKIVRGRAIQNMMYEGKEKRAELIAEMRSTHALQEQEQEILREEKQTTIALQRQRHVHEHKEFLVDQAMSCLEGETLGDTLDFLSKELIRLQEERRIHAFLMLAERQRRIREAEESGRRQVEERRRREADEIFKQVVKVHQDSVETYLTDMILSATHDTADEAARREIEEKAIQINNIAYEVEQTRDALQSEEIVADLTHCFLLPEVQKLTMREQVQAKQRKYLMAAHREICHESEPIIQMNAQTPIRFTPTESAAERSDSETKGSDTEGKGSGSDVQQTDSRVDSAQKESSEEDSRAESQRGSGSRVDSQRESGDEKGGETAADESEAEQQETAEGQETTEGQETEAQETTEGQETEGQETAGQETGAQETTEQETGTEQEDEAKRETSQTSPTPKEEETPTTDDAPIKEQESSSPSELKDLKLTSDETPEESEPQEVDTAPEVPETDTAPEVVETDTAPEAQETDTAPEAQEIDTAPQEMDTAPEVHVADTAAEVEVTKELQETTEVEPTQYETETTAETEQ